MRLFLIPRVVIGILVLSACDKEEAKGVADAAPAESASASAAPSATPAPAPSAPPSASAASAPLPKCASGFTGNAVPPFCIKLPASYKLKEARSAPTRGAVDYDTGTTTDILGVTYDDTPLAAVAKDVESEMKFGGDKLEKKGDLPGGGKWFRGTHAEYARVVSLVKAAPFTLKCSFAYQPKKAPPQEAIDACKTVAVP
jgi:hypothetical protein